MNPYTVGTVLTRIDPQNDPRDVIRVVSLDSSRGGGIGEWVGAAGDGVVVTPHDTFGPTFELSVLTAQAEYSIAKYIEQADGVLRATGTHADEATPEQLIARGANEVSTAHTPNEVSTARIVDA